MKCPKDTKISDPVFNALFINKEVLQPLPEYEQSFNLFHELRHAGQCLLSEQFDGMIAKSRFCMIMHNGIRRKLGREHDHTEVPVGHEGSLPITAEGNFPETNASGMVRRSIDAHIRCYVSIPGGYCCRQTRVP